MPLPAPGSGSIGLGEKLFLAADARRGGRRARRRRRPWRRSPGRRRRRRPWCCPRRRCTWPASFSVSARLVADWKRSSAVTRVSLRPHTPPALLTMLKYALTPFTPVWPKPGHEAGDLADVADLDLGRRHAGARWPCRACRRRPGRVPPVVPPVSPPVVPPVVPPRRSPPRRCRRRAVRRRPPPLPSVTAPAVGGPAGGRRPRSTMASARSSSLSRDPQAAVSGEDGERRRQRRRTCGAACEGTSPLGARCPLSPRSAPPQVLPASGGSNI